MINMIWAMDEKNLIGNDNKLPWHYKEDLQFFKKMTLNKTVLMGSKTYLSIVSYLKKPLPGRLSIVVTRTLKNATERYNQQGFDNVIFIDDIDSYLQQTKEDIFIIGGKSIYEQCLKYANNLYVTHIKKTHVGDTYMNNIDFSNFNKTIINETKNLQFAKYERKI